MTSEAERLALIQSKLSQLPSVGVVHGIGDDTAVLQSPKKQMLFGSDMMVEGVHFDLSLSSPEDIGYKALARTLSDIAATNGRPLYALVSLCLSPSTPNDFLGRFYDGLAEATKMFACAIVGGDLTSSKQGLFIDISVIGETAKPILRSGAKPGDLIAVTGTLGDAAAGLAALRAKLPQSETLTQAYGRPRPRFDVIEACSQRNDVITSMIDISDGLASELYHLSEASNASFVIDEKTLPLSAALIKTAQALGGRDPLDWVYGGGDDYQLLVTLDQDKWQRSPELHEQFTLIGHVEDLAHANVWVISTKDQARRPLKRQGWDVFSDSK